MDARYEADTKIANSKRQYEMQKACFDVEVNTQVILTELFEPMLFCICGQVCCLVSI